MTINTPEPEPALKAPDLDPLNTRGWPDMSLANWKRWGFEITEVLRTPRRNFIFYPTESTLFERPDPNPAFVLRGEWYRVGAGAERRIAQWTWPALILGLILFASMLKTIMARMTWLPAILFVAMYLLFEGFTTFMLRGSGSKSIREIEIPWNSLSRVVLLANQGIILLAFEDDGVKRGLTIHLSPETAAAVTHRIESARLNLPIARFRTETLSTPPANID